jgi:hypothetical protein
MAKLLGINLFCLISVDKRFLWLCIENILKKDIDVVILPDLNTNVAFPIMLPYEQVFKTNTVKNQHYPAFRFCSIIKC